MGDIEVKLREGMNARGITGDAQQQIVGAITSFALYGFPESHAASFALIAYASAYLKCHYLAAFTAAILNNQPMGFYSPATLVKDAQRHGLCVLPIDVTRSEWRCGLERRAPRTNPSTIGTNQEESNGFALRLGLNYVRGLREVAGLRIARERRKRPFESIDDLVRRVSELQRNELTLLAEVGALNFIDRRDGFNRRDALWQVERASRREGPLLESVDGIGDMGGTGDAESRPASPLRPMSAEERLTADFRISGLTMGPHPMALGRERLRRMGVRRAVDLAGIPDGAWVRTAGCVIARQRPATAKGFVFLSIEDETGIANVIFTPDMLEKNRAVITTERFILIEGRLQHQENVVSVKARKVHALDITAAHTRSRDFY
jgi:error-prone DNA polymerase